MFDVVDVQFWRSRKSLEGLSVRSVFFNVFQSLIVLLYILDNETNYVVIVSVFVGKRKSKEERPRLERIFLPPHPGLCIEMWKVTKVVQIRVDQENLIAGVFPRIVLVDRPSYSSSTKEYDMVSCLQTWSEAIAFFSFLACFQVSWLGAVPTADRLCCLLADVCRAQGLVFLHLKHELRLPPHIWFV